MKKKNRFQYVLILDQSGSMSPLQDEVIQTYNEQIEYLQKLSMTEKVNVTCCTFNDEIIIHYLKEEPNKLKKLNRNSYHPDSCTALYDAIGICSQKVLSNIKKKDKLFFVVFTDGMENASVHFNEFQINQLFNKLQKDGHSITFMCREHEAKIYHQKFDLKKENMLVMEDCMFYGCISESFSLVQDKIENEISNLSQTLK